MPQRSAHAVPFDMEDVEIELEDNALVRFGPLNLPDNVMAGWRTLPRQDVLTKIATILRTPPHVRDLDFLAPLNRVQGYRRDPISSKMTRLRISIVLDVLHGVLDHPVMTIRLRGLWYRVKAERLNEAQLFFPSDYYLSRTIRYCCVLCGCNRQSLGILAANSGYITGPASVQLPDRTIQLQNMKFSIDGNVATKADLDFAGRFSTDAGGVILFVESEEAFDALVDGGLCRNHPILMITGCGMSAYAVLALLYRIHATHSRVPIMALTDYNLSGFHIQRAMSGAAVTERTGMSEEYDPQLTIPCTWIGMTSDDVRDHVSAHVREALTPKELNALRRAIKFYSGDEDTEVDNQNIDDACRELIRMRDAEIKAQIANINTTAQHTLADIVFGKITNNLPNMNANNQQ